MADFPACRCSAAELAAAYGCCETTPDMVLDSVLARLKQLNPALNVVVTV